MEIGAARVIPQAGCPARRHHLTAAGLAVLLAAAGVEAAAAAAPAEDPPPAPILAPPPLSSHAAASGPVRFIGRGAATAELKLDGKAIALTSPHEGVFTAEIGPGAPGVHELEFEGQKLRFAVTGPGGGAVTIPDEFKAFRPHPPANQCQTCHLVRAGRWRFQRVSLASVCSQCHARETFPAKHTHEMAVLTDCQLCHNPHGSTAAVPAHLKLSRDVACKQCHALQ